MILAPLAVELFAGTGSATAGWCALGGRAVCFDLEYLPHHGKPHAGQQRVIQDVLTLHGSQFRDAAFIWGSPPCQNYSYLAMPWSRSKPVPCECRELMMQLPEGSVITGQCKWCGDTGFIEHSKKAKALRKKWETEGPDNRLFDACFRIQREAIEATRKACDCCRSTGRIEFGPNEGYGLSWVGCSRCNGRGYTERYIPLIVENVRGAIPWVGKRDMPILQWLALSQEEKIRLGQPKAAYGSFMLWGDVEMVGSRIFAGDEWKRGGAGLRVPGRTGVKCGGSAGDDWFAHHNRDSFFDRQRGSKVPGFRFDGSGRSFQTASVDGMKTGHPERSYRNGHKSTAHLTNAAEHGTKVGGDWFRDPACHSAHGSRSNARKAASAMIAKIPVPLSNYIAKALYPKVTEHENQPATLSSISPLQQQAALRA